MKSHKYYVYILTNFSRTVLYIGLTNDLSKRLTEHQLRKTSGFTSKYKADILIYFEEYSYVYDAIAREKQLKK